MNYPIYVSWLLQNVLTGALSQEILESWVRLIS